MKTKKKLLIIFLCSLLIFLINLLPKDSKANNIMSTKMITLSKDKIAKGLIDNELKVIEIDTSKEKPKVEEKIEETQEEQENNNNEEQKVEIEEDNNIKEETVEEIIPEPEPQIVFDGLTMEELANKLERSMKNELSGNGYLYASYSLEKGVDPYLALAISLEETGCTWNCSRLVKACNNVGGMIGSSCNGFSSWPTLEEGIKAFIDNIARNYVAYGLTTAETMNPKYAENPAWAANVNAYINRIKNN